MVVRGDPTIFENTMCKMFCPKICAAFSKDAFQDSNLVLVPLNVPTEEITALMIVCPTITKAKRLVSLITGPNCIMDAVSWSFKCILGLCGCYC